MNYYNEIKETLINNEDYKKIKEYSKNKNDLNTYFEVGKLLIEAQGGEEKAKYGNGLIKEYSEKLTKELGKGYSIRNLRNMRQFYLVFRKRYALRAELSLYFVALKFRKCSTVSSEFSFNCYIKSYC